MLPPGMERQKEGPIMKSLGVIMRFVVVLLLLGFLVGQALAERPQTREIKSKVMWGDPDCPWSRERRPEDMLIGDPEQGNPDTPEEIAISIGFGTSFILVGPMRELSRAQNVMTAGRGKAGAHMAPLLNSARKR